MFLSCRPFVIITTFSTSLVGVENFVLTTQGLLDRDIQLLDGTTVENKGKYIYIYIRILVIKLFINLQVGQPMYALWQQNEQQSALVSALLTDRTSISRK